MKSKSGNELEILYIIKSGVLTERRNIVKAYLIILEKMLFILYIIAKVIKTKATL